MHIFQHFPNLPGWLGGVARKSAFYHVSQTIRNQIWNTWSNKWLWRAWQGWKSSILGSPTRLTRVEGGRRRFPKVGTRGRDARIIDMTMGRHCESRKCPQSGSSKSGKIPWNLMYFKNTKQKKILFLPLKPLLNSKLKKYIIVESKSNQFLRTHSTPGIFGCSMENTIVRLTHHLLPISSPVHASHSKGCQWPNTSFLSLPCIYNSSWITDQWNLRRGCR